MMDIPTTTKYFFLLIILVSLDGSNGQLTISVVDVPDSIDMMLENITVTSATTANTLNEIVNTQRLMANAVTQMVNLLQMQNEHLQNIVGQLDKQNRLILSQDIPRDCSELASRGAYPSGSYTIRPNLRVYCDMDNDGGGWTVFQKRFDGSVDFYLGWDAYEDGFGSLDGEYWMGLRQMHQMTQQGDWTLRIDLQDIEDNTAYAEYRLFSVGDAESFYRLSIGAYSGTAGDSLTWHNNQAFTTKDSDHDAWSGNCGQDRQGAWWYYGCAQSNLNGLYLGASQDIATGMNWYHWKNSNEVLKRSEMKMRRICNRVSC